MEYILYFNALEFIKSILDTMLYPSGLGLGFMCANRKQKYDDQIGLQAKYKMCTIHEVTAQKVLFQLVSFVIKAQHRHTRLEEQLVSIHLGASIIRKALQIVLWFKPFLS
jgi:hypothetical protein